MEQLMTLKKADMHLMYKVKSGNSNVDQSADFSVNGSPVGKSDHSTSANIGIIIVW